MKIIKALFSRITLMILAVIVEGLILFSISRWFSEKAAWINEVLRVFSVIIVLYLIKNSKHLSSDMIWIVGIMLFPIPGTALYLLLGADLISSRTYRSLSASSKAAREYLAQDDEVLSEVKHRYPDHQGEFHYISKSAGFPFYRSKEFDYYGLGDTGYPVMLEELKKAEKFIFLEYFIIEEGVMWNGILDILEEKAAQGVDVRVMYDDLGSFMTLSMKYAKKLNKKGIRCISFNRINPILSIIMNNRDHRKIMIIDGKTAFSGGVNLADEYINLKTVYGHWKDNIIRVKGEAVWSYTVMFLSHWNALSDVKDTNWNLYRCDPEPSLEYNGFIAPYGETPLDYEITAQNIYMGMLNEAQNYCYIYTPYLIIDTELINALILSAKHGVDVKMITPGIPDKKLVWRITRSYYRQLIEGGVKIYEYTPGFVHSKVFVTDDTAAAVGTVNLDYRSLYLHFENGTFLCGSDKVLDVKKDFEETLEKCHEMTLEESTAGFFGEFVLAVLRLFAPLM